MESSCPLPERPDRPVMRPDAVWTLARVGSAGTVDAVVTLYRGLPEGISQQVADRTSQRLPTDGNDPGTVLDPPYAAVEVRGTTGTLVEGRGRFEGTRVIWTEPSRGTWSVQSFGLTTTDVLAIAGRLRVVGDHLEPGEPLVSTPSEGRAGDPGLPLWYLLEVPTPPQVTVGEVVRTAVLRARMPGRDAGTTLFTSVQQPFPGAQDWRVLVRPGDEIVEVSGLDALVSRDGVTGLLFDLPSGAQAGLSLRAGATMEPVSTRSAVDALRAAAESLVAVPLDDPRLRDAVVDE